MEQQITLPVNKKYTQEWGKYNLAKTNEKRLFLELLYDLSKIIKEPKQHLGRPSIELADLFYCAGLKLYSNYSGRKAMSDYKFSKNAGYIKRVPHFNTLKDFLNCEATYDLLSKLLTITAIPLKKIEDQFSLDSSGFGSYSNERWIKAKYQAKKNFKNYLKGHILVGTKTNIICSCEITPGNFSDVKQAPSIILKANKNFNIKEFSADKAYSSKLIYRIIEAIGAMPYIPFKHNTKEPTNNSPEIWNNMFLMFRNKSKEWEKHYHVRNNVETTFAMIKRRFGEILLSKNYVAQRNELMMKFICHNICCLIQEMYELGIKINFEKSSLVYVERKVFGNLVTRDPSNVQNCQY